MMDVSLTNEVRHVVLVPVCQLYQLLRLRKGPVTFTLDSRKFEYVDQPASRNTKGKKQSKTAKSTQITDAVDSHVAE